MPFLNPLRVCPRMTVADRFATTLRHLHSSGMMLARGCPAGGCFCLGVCVHACMYVGMCGARARQQSTSACKAAFATLREISPGSDAYKIRPSIWNVTQKNPPNYCQGLSMFPVHDNKNVRNSRPLANVGNFQQNCNRASKGSTRTRTTTKRSACETIVRARAMQARSDNVWRDGKCAMQSLAKARHTHTHQARYQQGGRINKYPHTQKTCKFVTAGTIAVW